MSCQFERQAQAYLDGELKKEDYRAFTIHLQQCSFCRTKMSELILFQEWSEQALNNVFAPTTGEADEKNDDTEQAWETFSQKIAAGDNLQKGLCNDELLSSVNDAVNNAVITLPIGSDADLSIPSKQSESSTDSLSGAPVLLPGRKHVFSIERSWPLMKKYRKLVTGLTAVVILAGFLMIPQVQAYASEFLALFRVSKIQMVTITPQDLQQVENFFNSGEKGQITIDDIGKMTLEEGSFKPQGFATAADAEKSGIKVPAAPQGYTAGQVFFKPSATMKMELNTEKINTALKNFGSEYTFDNSLNGKVFSVVMPDSTSVTFQNSSSQGFGDIVYSELGAPQIEAPSLTDAEKLRTSLLQAPFIPENIRSQLAQIQDWQNTLPFPAFEGAGNAVVSQKLTVIGGDGIFITCENNVAGLLWENNGKLYSLHLSYPAGMDAAELQSSLLKLADNF